MFKTFGDYARLREDDEGSSVGPSLGTHRHRGGDAHAAFKDLLTPLEAVLTGPVLSAVVNAVMGAPNVPERAKQEIRNKVQSHWSHVVDLSDSPPGQGPGLGNSPGFGANSSFDPSMSNVVVPPQSDQRGA